MAAQGQAQGGVVPQHLLALGGAGQCQRILQRQRALQKRRHGAQRGGLPDLLAALAGQRHQGVGGGQLLQVLLIQPGAQGQVLRIAEQGLGAGRLDAPRRRASQAADQLQAQAHGRLMLAGDRLQAAFHAAAVDIHRAHLDVVAARVLHQLAGRVKAQRL